MLNTIRNFSLHLVLVYEIGVGTHHFDTARTKVTQRNWTADEIEVLCKLAMDANYSIRDIAHTLNRTNLSVKAKIFSMGIKGVYPNERQSSKFWWDQSFFSQDSSALWYFIGLFYADGNIYRTRVSLAVGEQDQHFLESVVRQFSDHPIHRYQFEGNWKDVYTWSASCRQLAALLQEKFDITPRKSYTIQFPKSLPDRYLWNFVHGYFDGDGSVYQNRSSLEVRFSSVSKKFLEQLKGHLDNIGISSSIGSKKKKPNQHVLCVSTNGSRRLAELFYDESYICLMRKKDRFQSFRNIHDYFSSSDLATIFMVSKRTIVNWRKKFDLPYTFETNCGKYYSEQDVQIWKEKLGHLSKRVA